ncbi:MAG: hypothetical protein V2I76_09635 [Roseobacter sp.]|jgi:hypothetical protein|nr:hypothetical protein [Roseobacter sp.]
MFFELIGTIMAGVSTALILWAVNRTLLKGRLPSWLIPTAAGAAMLIATISSEYGWYERTTRAMPEGMVVAQTVEESVFYRPWTYAIPLVTRFIAVDQATTRTHPDQPKQRIVDLVIYGRWTRTAKVPVLFDCGNSRRADIVDGIEFGGNGEILGAEWIAVNSNDPVFTKACEEM